MPLNLVTEDYTLTGLVAAITHVGVTTADPGIGSVANPGEPSGMVHQKLDWGPIGDAHAANTNRAVFALLPCTLLYATFWYRPATYYGYTYYGAPPPTDTYLGFMPVLADSKHSFDFATIASDGTLTSPRHALGDGDLLRLSPALDGTLPDPFTSGPLYNVVNSTSNPDKFQLTADTVQTVTITGSPTGGSFILTFASHPTAAIAPDAAPAVMQAALEALPGIGVGNVLVTNGAPAGLPWTVTFVGDLGATDVPVLTVTPSLTGGTSPTAVVDVVTHGSGVVIPSATDVVFWRKVVPRTLATAATFTIGAGIIDLSSGVLTWVP